MFVSMSGTVIAQIVTFLITPIITRLYLPSDLGVLNSFTTVTSLILPVAMFSFHVAIVLTKNKEEQYDLAKLSLSFSLIICCLVVLIGLCLFTVNVITNSPLYIGLVAIFVFFSSVMQLCEQFAVKSELFGVIAKCSIIQAICNNISKVSFAFAFHPSGLVLVICSVIAVASPLVIYRNFIVPIFRHDMNFKNVALLVKKYKEFPLFQMPQSVINALSHGVPVIFIAYYMGADDAGLYGLSRTVLGMPILLLGASVSSVLYPRFVSILNDGGKFHRELFNYIIALFFISVLGFSVFLFFGRELFSMAFGNEWGKAGDISGYMVPLFIMMLCSRPIIPAIAILSMQKQLLINEVFSLIFKIISLFVGCFIFKSLDVAIITYSIVGALVYCTIIYQVLSSAKKRSSSAYENCN